ncbi:MAG: hypothetical protein IPH75_09745 [bacterium]|nr:hypothetical protein [bacterium]
MKIISFLLLVMLVGLGCSTTFYSTIFRVESTSPQIEYREAPKDVIDGSIGVHMGWDWLARAVSSYETNDSTRLIRNSYAFTLQMVAKVIPATSPAVDSLIISLSPSGSKLTVPFRHMRVDSVNFGDETRRILRFGAVDIPPDVDTLEISFTARDGSAGAEEIQYRMVRYNAKYEKFGFRARE